MSLRFIKPVAWAGMVVLLLTACGGVPTSREGRQARRSPVPISAALREDFKEALAVLKAGDYEKAVPLLEAIVGKNPQLPGAQINLAIAYMKREPEDADDDSHMEKAEQALLTAVETNPRDAVAYNQLGLLYRKTGRFDKARQAYEKALEIDGQYAIAHLNLGILCDIYLQDLECAIDRFKQYAELEPGEAEQVNLWLTDLRRRAGLPQPAANNDSESKEVQDEQ